MTNSANSISDCCRDYARNVQTSHGLTTVCNRCGNCGFGEFLEEKVLRDRHNSPVSN